MSIKENEKLLSTAPLLSDEEKLRISNTRKYMLDTLTVLIAPTVMACYYYGLRALLLIVISAVTAVLCEVLGCKLIKSQSSLSDLSSLVTGIAIALCLPASSPWWLALIASSFAILAAKLPFGSSRGNMFVPAAAGIAFVTVCCKDIMFAYPVIPTAADKLTVYSSDSFVSGEAISYMLSQGNSIGTNLFKYIDIFVGNISGPMGATYAVALLGGLIFLLFRRPHNAVTTLCYFAVCAVFAFLFPRISAQRYISVFMELNSGLLFFSGLVFLNNEAIAPKRFAAKACYGALAGLIVMLLRHVSAFEDSTVFAILLINAVAPMFDKKLPLTKNEKKDIIKTQAEQPFEQTLSDGNGGALNG